MPLDELHCVLRQSIRKIVYVLSYRRKVLRSKKLLKSIQICFKNAKGLKDLKLKQSKKDVARLLMHGQLDTAFAYAEQHLKNKNIWDALDLLEHFCKIIFDNLPNICRIRVVPIDINEAMASLSYAAAMCKDVPELQRLWELFNEQYSYDFKNPAIKLMPENYVNKEIIAKLCIKNITHDQKLRLIKEIAMDYKIQLGPLKLHETSNAYDPQDVYSDHDWEEEFNEKGSSTSQAQEETTVYEGNIYDPPVESCDSNLEEVLYRSDSSASSSHEIEVNGDSKSSTFLDPKNKFSSPNYGHAPIISLSDLPCDGVGDCKSHLQPSPLSHVHPKLPDYDDLVAKFTEIKKYQRKISVGDSKNSTFPDTKDKVSSPNYHAPIVSSLDLPCKEVGDCKSYFQPSSLSHLHLKLPDYDDLVAKFTGIKKYQWKFSVGDTKSSNFPHPKKKVSSPNYHAPIISSSDLPCKGVAYCSNFQTSSLSHVHPKLPDYDDLVVKFTALKKNILDGSGKA